MDSVVNAKHVDDWLCIPTSKETTLDKKNRKNKEKQDKIDVNLKLLENAEMNKQKALTDNKKIDIIVKEANIIYSDYMKRMRNDTQFQCLSKQSRFEYYMKKYIDFARQYPIILRHIASYGMHSEKAIRLYMKKCYNQQIYTDEEYCERQADFVKYLYMHKGNHCSQEKLGLVWTHTKKHLMDEIAANKKERDVIKKRREKNKESNNIERRENVKRIIELRK
jgi:hypothetical protein